MPYLYDNKDAEFLNQFKLLLTGQYQGAQVSPSGANRFRKGSHGRENEWRRLQIGFEAVFFKNRLTLHSLTNMGELDGMYKVEDGRWRRTKTDWSIFELYLKYKVNPSFFARVGKITSKMTANSGRRPVNSRPWNGPTWSTSSGPSPVGALCWKTRGRTCPWGGRLPSS